MADVVDLSDYRNIGNGAREAVQRYFDAKDDGMIKWMHRNGDAQPTLPLCDHFLGWLWVEGFKVVPLEPKDEGDIRA